MYVFTIVSKPREDNPESKEVGGAYITVWIQYGDIETAEKFARYKIEEAGWIPGLTTKSFEFDKIVYDDLDYLACFEEAERCGISLLFEQWRVDADDADVDS